MRAAARRGADTRARAGALAAALLVACGAPGCESSESARRAPAARRDAPPPPPPGTLPPVAADRAPGAAARVDAGGAVVARDAGEAPDEDVVWPPVVFRARNTARAPRAVQRLPGAAEVRIEQSIGANAWAPVQSSPGTLPACTGADRARLGAVPPAGTEVLAPRGALESTWRAVRVRVARDAAGRPCVRVGPAIAGRYRATVFGCGPVEFALPLASSAPIEVRCTGATR